MHDLQTKFAQEHDSKVHLRYELDVMQKKFDKEKVNFEYEQLPEAREFAKLRREVLRKDTKIIDLEKDNV